MKNMIGFPDEFANMSKLTEAYAGLKIDPKNYFKNQALSNMFLSMVLFSKMKEPIDYKNPLNGNSLYIGTLGAFYNFQDNTMVVPAVSLDDRMFDSDRPMYTNYGAIGFIIGHEITHGFDNTGRLFDSKGNRVEGLWDPETVTKLSFSIICQYSNPYQFTGTSRWHSV